MTPEKFLLDTNILIRLVVKDSMVSQLDSLIAKVESGEVVLVVEPLIFAEVICVLQGYKHPQTNEKVFTKGQIAKAMEVLLDTEGFEFVEKEILRKALISYHNKNVDFQDSYLAAKSTSTLQIISFDKDIPDFALI